MSREILGTDTIIIIIIINHSEIEDHLFVGIMCGEQPTMFPSNHQQTQTQTQSSIEAKEDDIYACLMGRTTTKTTTTTTTTTKPTEWINLWALRELALTRYGFVSWYMRKQAWPKLLRIHELLLLLDTNHHHHHHHHHPIGIDCHHFQQIQQWVQEQLFWKIQDHLQYHHVRKHRTNSTTQQRRQRQRQRQVSFSLEPDTMFSLQYQQQQQTIIDGDDTASSTSTRNTTRTMMTMTTMTQSNCPVKPNKYEQHVLFNILLNWLRQDSSHIPFKGIQNVTAVLLIQTESPSITSLLLDQWTKYYYNVVVVPHSTFMDNSSTVMDDPHPHHPHHCHPHTNQRHPSSLFLPLLQQVDPTLYQHWRIHGIHTTPSCIQDSWIPLWFTQDILRLDIITRLWDVLLVSHPLASMYV